MEPRLWSISLSSSDVILIISHGDIPPTIQTPTSSVTMESAFSLERFFTIAADLDYVLLLGQPLPEFLCTAWHISSQPAPSVPLVLGQRVLLVSPASRMYFGHLKSKQGSITLLRSPYRVQNLPLTAQQKTALQEHQMSCFCPTEAQSKSFVTLCDQL